MRRAQPKLPEQTAGSKGESNMAIQVILEGLGLGILLILVCAFGIRRGAVGMVHLYSPEV